MLVSAPSGADGNAPRRSAGGPVPLAALAEVPRLVDVVVVEVAELGVRAVAARAGEELVWLPEKLAFVGNGGGGGRSAILFWRRG